MFGDVGERKEEEGGVVGRVRIRDGVRRTTILQGGKDMCCRRIEVRRTELRMWSVVDEG